jgi:threonine dehydratase
MPDGAPQVKADGCRRLGAEVIRHGDVYDDALAYAQSLARDRGHTYVQSFDDPLVAAGQASVAWEVVEDLPDVDVLVAPVGGGGLMAGILSLLKTMPDEEARRWFPERRRPLADIIVVGVQATGAAATVASLRAGHPIELPSIATVADGIALRRPGTWTFEVLRQLLDDIVLVTDDEMLSSVGFIAVREKLISEPAGAAAVSAVLHGGRGARVDLGELLRQGKKIACVISGGNVMPVVLGDAIRAISQ